MVSPSNQKPKQHPLFFPLCYPPQWLYHWVLLFLPSTYSSCPSISLWPHCQPLAQTTLLPPIDLDDGNSSQQVFLHPLFPSVLSKRASIIFRKYRWNYDSPLLKTFSNVSFHFMKKNISKLLTWLKQILHNLSLLCLSDLISMSCPQTPCPSTLASFCFPGTKLFSNARLSCLSLPGTLPTITTGMTDSFRFSVKTVTFSAKCFLTAQP